MSESNKIGKRVDADISGWSEQELRRVMREEIEHNQTGGGSGLARTPAGSVDEDITMRHTRRLRWMRSSDGSILADVRGQYYAAEGSPPGEAPSEGALSIHSRFQADQTIANALSLSGVMGGSCELMARPRTSTTNAFVSQSCQDEAANVRSLVTLSHYGSGTGRNNSTWTLVNDAANATKTFYLTGQGRSSLEAGNDSPFQVAGAVGWNAPWTDYGAPWSPCTYMKDALGIVHLQGLMMSSPEANASPTQVAFTLPSGYRPVNTAVIYSCLGYSNGTPAVFRIDITTVGAVTFMGRYIGASGLDYCSWVTLNGISFPTNT